MIRHDDALSPDDHVALDVLSLLSKKWHPVVIVVLTRHGPMGFNDLLEAIPDVSGKVLTDSLEALSDAGLVERHVVSESPLRVEYELTNAGDDMRPIFTSLTTWGRRHLGSATPTVLVADADRRLTELYGDWIADRYAVLRAHDGDELETHLAGDVDVVLLDDGVPGVDTGAILEAVGETARTILLVGDRPGVDLLELGCDDVLRKPIVRETVLETIDGQLDRRGGTADQRERAALAAKLSFLETIYPPERLARADAYLRAEDRLTELEG
ncbi:winged helix-turn-helix transcriptional regulator [Natrarchaeobius oligotrophus]|uniref:HoxA-like transcriptional regulator n=1 Tax=Natrarchaeobius chitinivorans TaxID=1679083 RepID=A0A3N6PUR5_NATCH|nr:winged helix-turn-helix transcriptional regulator [Natrarchaeobius chitinivorans]RQH03566.1 HoxA-like transcriptional regulator [Natrarchaeobius chitinivorans]